MAKKKNFQGLKIKEEYFDADYFIEHLKNKTNWSMPFIHTHNNYELYFLVSGDVRYSIGYQLFDMSPGDVIIIPKNVQHRSISLTESALERFIISFSDEFIAPFINYLGQDMFDNLLSNCIRLKKEHQNRAYHIFSKMAQIQSAPDSFSRARIFTFLCELIILIARHGTEIEHLVTDTTESRIMKAAAYIKTHYNEDLSLISIASSVHMEATYFSKCFKKNTGFNFHDFLMQTRLTEAETFLRTTDYSIALIAEACGFSGSNHFGDAFKKHYGVSPRIYRYELNNTGQTK